MSLNSKEGWLSKESKKIKSWKKRWFVLNKNRLNYYRTPGSNLLGSIDLTNATEINIIKRKNNSFEINIPDVRTYRFKSESQEELNCWVESLNKCINQKMLDERLINTNSQSNYRYSLEDFNKIENLGKGSFGKVSLVQCKRDGNLYAMKTMNKKMLEDYDQVQASIHERNILFEINHPFIVSAHFSFQTEDCIFLILDYVSGGNLLERIHDEDYFNEDRARLYAAETALALGYLHNLGYIYRDMKSDNILIDFDGHIKITDFGLIKGQMFRPNDTTTTFCGTPDYIAPESILEKPYTKDIDWWGLGILLYEMIVGVTPFYNENPVEMYRSIISNEPKFPQRISEKARNFICKLLQKNPKQRIGYGEEDIEAIKKDPFFDGLDWDDVINKKIQPEWIPSKKNSVNLNLTRDHSLFDQQEIATEKTQLAFKGFSQVNLLNSNPSHE